MGKLKRNLQFPAAASGLPILQSVCTVWAGLTALIIPLKIIFTYTIVLRLQICADVIFFGSVQVNRII